MNLRILTGLATTLIAAAAHAAPIQTVEELVSAVKGAGEGTNIELAAGTYRLSQPLDLPSGLDLKGAGIGRTIITNADTWQANPATLPDPETQHEKFDRTGYLIRCRNDAKNITVSGLTVTRSRSVPRPVSAPTWKDANRTTSAWRAKKPANAGIS